MRIVAIRALHEPLVHAMPGRHRKLRTLRGVAGETELVLLLRQQVLRCRRMVDRVTARAGHAVEGVLGAPNVGLAQVEGVTYQAGVEHLLRRHERKCARNGGFAAPCLYVLLPGSVASFAPRALRRLLA